MCEMYFNYKKKKKLSPATMSKFPVMGKGLPHAGILGQVQSLVAHFIPGA